LLSAPGQIITFDTFQPGLLPPGWVTAMTHKGGAPRWEIIRDASAPTQPYVLGQVSTDASSDRFPLALLDKPLLRDGDVSVRVKPVTGHADQSGGLVWRYRDPDNYYFARADALQKNVAVYKVQNGVSTPLVPKGLNARRFAVFHDIPSNAWFILKVAFRGPSFGVYVNHRRVLQGTDKTFTAAGRVGLWTQADSVTYFDDFRLYPK
jgi:hypothetical protein